MLKNLLKLVPAVAILSSLFVVSVQAAQVTQLDEAYVPVASRSVDDKNQGLKTALASVIVKNAGTESALSNAMVAEQLQSPSAWLSQFGYLEQDGQLMLKANFDQSRVINLLRQAHLPVWGSQRPLTLMWFAFETEGERAILSDYSTAPVRQHFTQAGTQRGLPMLFPVMDLDELTQVNVSDVRGMFVNNIAASSTRYQADFFAVASVEEASGSFKFQLSLFPAQGGPEALVQPLYATQGEADSMADVSTKMVAALSEYYVTRYAVANSGSQFDTKITFVNTHSLKQLVDIENYLKGLSAVKSAYVSQIQGDTAVFSLGLFGSEADFQRLLTLEPRISILSSTGKGSDSGTVNNLDNNTSTTSQSTYGSLTTPSSSSALAETVYQWQGR